MFKKHSSHLGTVVVITLVALLFTACEPPMTTIDSPRSGVFYSTAPDVRISFSEGTPNGLKAEINGHDITHELTVSGGSATAPGSAIRPYLMDGENRLALLQPESLSVVFQYDKAGPVVHITNVNDNGGLYVEGYAEDRSGVARVEFNGQSVRLSGPDNTFSAYVSNGDYMTVKAVDSGGNVSVQQLARPQAIVDNALAVRITPEGIDFMEKELAYILSGDYFATLVTDMNPLQTGGDIIGNKYTIYASDAEMGLADFDLEVVGDRRFRIRGSLPEVTIGFEADIFAIIGGNSTVTGEVGAVNTTFDTYADITVENGRVVVDIDTLKLDLTNIRTDIDHFPDYLITPVLNLFDWLVEIILADQLKTFMPDQITTFLDVFPDTLLLELDGKEIKPDIVPEAVTTADDNVDIAIGGNIISLENNGIHSLGSPIVETAPLPTPTNITPSGVVKDMGMVVNVNALNQALSAAFEAGMIHMTVTQSQIPVLSEIGSGKDYFRVRLEPSSVPVVALEKSGPALGKCTIRDVTLNFDIRFNGTSDFILFFGTTVDVEAVADINVTATNDALMVDFTSVPRIHIRNIDSSGVVNLPEGAIQRLVNRFTPVVLPFVMKRVKATPIPTFEGYTLSVADIWVIDEAAHYIAFAADMVSTHTGSSAPGF